MDPALETGSPVFTVLHWLLVAIVLLAASGLPALGGPRRANGPQLLSALLAVGGALLGLATTLGWFIGGEEMELRYEWALPGAQFHVAIDGLSAWFLIPVFLVSMLGTIYGIGYWPQSEHPDNGRKLRVFYGLLAAGMALLVISRNAILFLMGWEAMALAAYFLVTTEDHESQVREVGWIYLVATHLATLLLFALFGLLRGVTGTFEFTDPLPANVTTSAAWSAAIFVLALIGFGCKAGIMPLHFWLPGAHALAPSHVSAIMSGVIIKMGIYGLLRILTLFPHPPIWWGAVVLLLGGISGVLGIAFAIGQSDLKRLLAYSSIENIGVIFMGLGLALIGRSYGRADWVALGIGGAMLHVLNHAVFKSLLFFGSGAIVHATHTRRMDLLGGLGKKMPITSRMILVGVVAAAALPPLNAFTSELFIYIGLFRTLEVKGALWTAAAAPALAMVGAMVVACYVTFYGIVFLGAPRSDHGRHAHDPVGSILWPMGIQVLICVLLGLAPKIVAPYLDQAVVAWTGPTLAAQPLGGLAPLGWLTGINLMVLVLTLAGTLVVRGMMNTQGAERSGTWGCGYAAPTARMQYTASSMSEWLVRLFGWALRPQWHLPHLRTLFPQGARFLVEVHDVVLDDAVLPASRRTAQYLTWFRWVQQGSVQAYLIYIMAVTILLFLWR
ncbi:MAG: hydrogenase [Planctomycetes bacterium]|nr:hydrogenase [Planctomycetota bacterium]